MTEEVLAKIKKWQAVNLEEDLKNELANLPEDLLEDAFYTDLAFGTGGLRGVMGVGTNRMNVYIINKSTFGFGHYLQDKYPNQKDLAVTISFDCRHNSEKFAHTAANVLATMGFKVYLFKALRSTPELSFTTRYTKSVGGIMITASHNPPKYNGYKVYDELGCQLVPELADQVIKRIDEVEDIFNIPTGDFAEYVKNGQIVMLGDEIDEAYIANVLSVKVQDLPHKDNIKIVFTPLHGTASVKMVEMLKGEGYNVIPVAEQMIPDGNFTTLKSPNPEDKRAFELAIKYGHAHQADILIATDPDADRMGIAVMHNGEYHLLTGNQTGAILLDYLAKFKKHGPKANVYNTIVTSNFAKAICQKYGLNLIQTLTGFKYIGEQASLIEHTDEEFFFGFEESYGYVIKDFVRDKDSYQATLLLAEVASYYKSKGLDLVDVLYALFKEFGFYNEGISNIYLEGKSGSERIKRIMETFENMNLTSLNGKRIVRFEDYEKGIAIENGQTEKLKLPQSFVLKYVFEDGGWFVLRPSGTEPKLKIYSSVVSPDEETAVSFNNELFKTLNQMVEDIK